MHLCLSQTLLIFFTEWLHTTGRDQNFEQMDKEVLAETLHIFYPYARQKPKQDSAECLPYQKQSLINICSAINRHLQLPPSSSYHPTTEHGTWSKTMSSNQQIRLLQAI